MAARPYAAMQAVLRDQTAAAQAMREAAESIKNASDMMAITLGNGVTENGPSQRHFDQHGQPIGNRPRMPDNQSTRPNHDNYGHGSNHGYGRGISGLRSMVADQLHGQIGVGGGPQFQPTFDSQGNHTGYHQYNPDGTSSHRRVGEDGLEDEVRIAARRGQVSRVISGFTGNPLQSARAVPYVGAAVMGAEAVHEGFVQFGKQREANAQYQSIYGGSNLAGMGQRMQGEGFKLGQLFSGGLTASQSEEAFRGVSRLGFQGQQRSTDLNFISSNYKSMGMGVAESLQLIETASKGLNTSLKGLQDGLKSVTSAAKETGQSAVAARQVFSGNYAAIAATNPGIGAVGLANALSTQQVGLGRSMQGLNFTQPFTTQGGIAQLSQLAGGLNGPGESMSAFRADILNGSTRAMSASDTLIAQITNRFLTPQVRAAIDDSISRIPGGRNTIKGNPDIVAAQITPRILPMVNADEIVAAWGRLGQTGLNPDQAVTLLIQTYLGQFGNLVGQHDEMMAAKQQNTAKLATSRLGHPSSALRGSGNGWGTDTKMPKGVNPVVDDALSTLKGQHVIVNSAGGARVVSIQEAAQDYTDQIAKGTATMADGNNVGQTVSQALGGEAETNYVGTDTSNYRASKGQTTKTSGLNSDRGMTIDAFNASQKKKADKTSGTVIITPSKELLQLLSFQATGNVAIASGGAATNSVPVPGS